MRQEESDIKFNMNNEDKKLMDYYYKAIMEDKMSRGGSWGSNFYYKLNESPESQENHGELIYRELPKNVYVWHLCLTNINVILLSTWGEVYTWGGITPCIGRKLDKPGDAYTPTKITTFTEPVVNIAAGNGHVLACDTKSNVYCWGLNSFGQLGEDPKLVSEIIVPKQMKFFNGKKIEKVFAGDFTSSAVASETNLIYFWGLNTNMQIIKEKKSIIITPTSVSIDNAEERENLEKQEEFGQIELPDAEKYFGEYYKPEESPYVLLMKRKLHDTEKKIAIMNKRIREKNQEEVKELNNPHQKAVIENEHSLHYYTASRLKQLEKKQEELKEKKRTINSEKQNCTEEIRSIENELKENKDRLKSQAQEDSSNLEKKIKSIEEEKSEKERNEKLKESELKKIEKKIETNSNLINSYSDFKKNLLNRIKKQQADSSQSELENFLIKMDNYYKQVQATSVFEMRKKSEKDKDIKDIIEESNHELQLLSKIPSDLKVEKSDPCYDVLSKIQEIILDNINLRSQINLYFDTLNDQTSKKIAELKKVPLLKPIDLKCLKDPKKYRLAEGDHDTKILLEIPKKNPNELELQSTEGTHKTKVKLTPTQKEETKDD